MSEKDRETGPFFYPSSVPVSPQNVDIAGNQTLREIPEADLRERVSTDDDLLFLKEAGDTCGDMTMCHRFSINMARYGSLRAGQKIEAISACLAQTNNCLAQSNKPRTGGQCD